MALFLFGLHVSKSSLKTNVRYWHKADIPRAGNYSIHEIREARPGEIASLNLSAGQVKVLN
jgi:hypothetical protein